jgi:hypothetical protein
MAPARRITYCGGPDGDGLADLQGHHSHFMLAETAEWGGETALMTGVAESLAGQTPVLMTLAGGGNVARNEVLHAARHGWPVFALAGTGRVADSLAVLTRAPQATAAPRSNPAATTVQA